MAEHVPHHHATPAISMVATATVIAGRLVEITGNRTVGPAPALSTKVFGVAARDAVVGLGVPVFHDGIHDLLCVGAIAAGDQVVAGAAGTVSTIGANAFGTRVGKAITAGVDGGTAQIKI